MIIKTFFRDQGGFGAYLTRVEPGHRAQFRLGLSRGMNNLSDGLRRMVALARLKPGIERSLVHTTVSPDHELSDNEVERTCEVYEETYGVRPDLRGVVGHNKGIRAEHFHLAYSRVGINGFAVQSHNSFEKDERISRQLEIEFGEKITPGPHLKQNIAEFRRAGRDDLANRLEPYLSDKTGSGLSHSDRTHAARHGVDAKAFSSQLYDVYEQAGHDLGRFASIAEQAGFSIAAGHSAILIVHDETGWSSGLGRLLKRECKAGGSAVKLREAELQAAFASVDNHDAVRDRGLDRAREKSEGSLADQERATRLEAAANRDAELIRKLEEFRRQSQQHERDEEENVTKRTETLKARREAIAARYRQRDQLRQLRVEAAFNAARLIDNPAVRKALFAATATTVLLTGAGLTAALVAGGVAIAALPTWAHAHRSKVAAAADRAQDRIARNRELVAATRESRQKFPSAQGRKWFSFADIANPDRILAGHYATALLAAGSTTAILPETARRAADALGPTVIEGINRMLRYGSPAQVRRLDQMAAGAGDGSRGKAVAAALARHSASVAQGQPARGSRGQNGKHIPPAKRDGPGR